jgi:MFS family permease
MDEVRADSAGSNQPAEYQKSPRKAVASGWIGSALEYYDFFIYATAAALVFPDVFFPKGNDQVALVGSLATYGVGYVARPLGAFYLGNWGDKYGRKNVLVLCMLLMGGATLLVAFLPSYAAIGIWAPILLLVLRLIQGFAVGGELSGASAMIVENAPFGRRGFFGSFTLQGTQGGQLIAAAVFLPLYYSLSDESMNSWGWRIPFALSAIVVIAGYIIRRRVDETPAFQEEAAHGEVPKSPLAQAFSQSWPTMVRVVCMALMNAIAVLTTIFGAAFATKDEYGVGMDTELYLFIPVIGNAIAMVLIPLIGNVSDRLGRRPPIIAAAIGSGLLAYPYLYFISKDNVPMTIVIAVLMWGCVYQGYNAVFPAFYQELFPTRTRVTAFAVSQNIGTLITAFLPTIYAAIAGPAPSDCVVDDTFVPTATVGGQTCRVLAENAQNHVIWTVGSITFGLALIAAASAYSARETYKIHLHDCGEDWARPVSDEEYAQARREAATV